MRTGATDAELIRRARTDPDAFADLYVRHVARVHRLVSSRVPASHAPDIVAETFAAAALALDRYRDPGDGSAAAWLCGIALNLLRRSYKRRRIENAPVTGSESRRRPPSWTSRRSPRDSTRALSARSWSRR